MEDRALQAVFEEAGPPVLALAAEGEGCRILWQNAAARRLCPQGSGILDMLPDPDRQALCARLFAKTAGGPLFFHIGSAVYAAAIFSCGGQTLCLLQEATDYYLSNERALHEAVMANRAKTSFLSEMSHDIRTPMGAIIGLTEIALAQQELPPRARECLDKIKTASGHMMSLLNEVLDMSRIESGKVVIAPSPVSVADLLHEILIVARPQADAKKLHFHLEMGEVSAEHIAADGVRLKQICLNLLSNAVKYTPSGGRVDLFFCVSPDSLPGRVRMTVRVQDNGIGMSPEFLHRLFTPFEREEKSTVNKIQGTGLGMTITKNLTEQMGGRIRVESEPDRGSCFTVEIPFEALPEEEEGAAILAGKRVLLLESSERQGALIRQMLESLQVAADWAKNAEGAVYLLNDADLSGREYFAFLTAEKLPDVEMMLFLPEVRKRAGGRFPILMLSESDWSQTEYMLTRAGVDGFIPLPLFCSRLRAELCARAGGGQRQDLPARGPNRDFSRRRLLLVEDNDLNREIAEELLGGSGVRIETAENGRQALERFSQNPPFYYDMVLMDIQMPVMNGLEAARAIRRLPREDAQLTPIIAMTANAFVEDVQNSLDAGMNAHISKPLDMEKVFSTMERFFGGAR